MSPQRPVGRSSLSPPDGSGSRSREGRTPPPAPSAAWARRAREIREDEGIIGLKPAAPIEIEPAPAESEEAVGSGYAAGYRRARAGTMPSKLEAERFTLPDDDIPAVSDTYVRTSALSPAYLTSPTRPSLRHTTSSAAELPSAAVGSDKVASPTSRHRSGSLGLPANLGNAFGASAFGNTWISTPGLSTNLVPSPLGKLGANGRETNDDPLLSLESPRDGQHSLAADQLNFSTLDYLGLAEDGQDMTVPASMAEARNLAQRVIAQQGPANRHRANTVANFNRPLRSSVTDEYEQQERYSEESALAQAMDHVSLYGGSVSDYGAFKDPHRPRAITVGTYDNPRRLRNGNGSGNYLQSIPQSPVHANLINPLLAQTMGYPPRSRSDHNLNRSRDPSQGPRMSSSHNSRSATPDLDRGGSTPQVPTRSLWIGNLDVNASSETLLSVFKPYGGIESVRLLPEKTCAFVNFMDKSDAIRARDDVLNRLGGFVSALSETAPVRIGFGKIDSAPNGPITSTVAPAPPGLVFTNGNIANLGAVTIPPPPVSAPSTAGADMVSRGVTSPEQGTEHSSMPTRALWIGSVPGTTSSATLLQIFSPFGPVESARVLMHKCCGFVNFERLDSAVSARNALNGQDILGSDVGPIRIAFARVPTKTPVIGGPGATSEAGRSPERLGEALNSVKGAAAVSTEKQVSVEGGGVENYRSPLVIDLVKAGVHEQVLEKGLAPSGVVSDQQMIMQVLSAGRTEEDGDTRALADTKGPQTYFTAIPNVADRGVRRFDVHKLKEYRKRLDGGMTQEEIDSMALELLEECAELASDHVGNTVIQKLYERVSYTIRFAMLERIAPHLASIGIHKNGTWAAQKIIECSTTEPERLLITSHLRPFAPPLMCDSLGNYVCAGSLRFGEPFSDYVYDAMVDRMWEVAQNRFGARCMRTCLESSHTSLYQKKRISTGIILNAIPLSTNPNGALLLTWLVDQSNLPGRYALLANRFAPHVAHLCTHKLASLTALRIISQNSEPAASTTLLSAIFTSPSDQTLSEILGDANNGAQVIGKILATSSIPTVEKDRMIESVRRVLPTIKASGTPPYRQLLETVGLPVPAQTAITFARGHMASGAWAAQQAQPGQSHTYGGYAGQYYPQHLQYAGYPQSSFADQDLTLNMQYPQSGVGAALGGQNGSGGGQSPRTPVPRARGRLSPSNQMLSPGSDPFNPFASPSIDVPYLQTHGQARLTNGMPMQFDQQPNVGGLGFMGDQNQGLYYQQQRGMGTYGRAAYQA